MNLKRPLIDTRPGQPLKFHGVRCERGGNVYAGTIPAVHGRLNPNYEVLIGQVRKYHRIWESVAPDGRRVVRSTQSEAAVDLMRYVEAHQ